MNIEYYGMILYDGTILINQAYYGLTFTHRDAFIIFFTLLHEIMQALSHLIRGNDNYLLNTAEFTKVKNNFLQRIQRKVDFILRTSFY